jgi:uncharacterized membrane protein
LKILSVIFVVVVVVVVVIIVGLVIYNQKKNENTDGIADREAISLATPSESS